MVAGAVGTIAQQAGDRRQAGRQAGMQAGRQRRYFILINIGKSRAEHSVLVVNNSQAVVE